MFTHAFVATGTIGKKQPDFFWSHLPDSRNLFDLASLTKAIVSAPLVHDLIHGQGAKLDDSIYEWGDVSWPIHCSQLSFRDVLDHRAGIKPWVNFWVNELAIHQAPETYRDRTERILQVLNRTSWIDPSKKGDDCYSDVGFIILGSLIENTLKKDLNDAFTSWILSLGINNLSFLPESQNAIPTGYCAIRKRMLYGEVHDENAASLGCQTGHAGLFSDGMSLYHAIEGFLSSQQGQRFLTHPFGWRKGDDPTSRVFGDGRSIGHLGFTGTAFWFDPKTERLAIFLTNRTISGRINTQIKEARTKVFAHLWSLYDK